MDIVRGTTVDGPGFRTSIYFAGCSHACLGCHNPQSWDFSAGNTMGIEEIMEIIREEEFNVTFSGGDPLYHPEFVSELSEMIEKEGYNIWLYTGFKWEEIISSEKMRNAIQHIDVIVDSPFILAERNTDLRFRGSSNQRIIDVKKSLASGMLTEWS